MAKVFTWGNGMNGQLGHGLNAHESYPRPVRTLPPELNIAQVAAGDNHSMVLTDAGEVYAWGLGHNGRLGLGGTANSPTPKLIAELSGKDVRRIGCGGAFSVCVTSDGVVYTWGDGGQGEIGDGGLSWCDKPKPIEALSGIFIVDVACGNNYCMALTDRGEVWSWGGGMYARLGHGDTMMQTQPKFLSKLVGINIVKVACGTQHTVALADNGVVLRWGMGQAEPEILEALQEAWVTDVSCGKYHTVVITQEGNGFVWDTTHMTVSRLRDLDGHKISKAVCGEEHTVLVSDVGDVYTMGIGAHGRLGHGDFQHQTYPKQISQLHGVTAVACGSAHCIAVSVSDEDFATGNSTRTLEEALHTEEMKRQKAENQLRQYERDMSVVASESYTSMAREQQLERELQFERRKSMESSQRAQRLLDRQREEAGMTVSQLRVQMTDKEKSLSVRITRLEESLTVTKEERDMAQRELKSVKEELEVEQKRRMAFEREATKYQSLYETEAKQREELALRVAILQQEKERLQEDISVREHFASRAAGDVSGASPSVQSRIHKITEIASPVSSYRT